MEAGISYLKVDQPVVEFQLNVGGAALHSLWAAPVGSAMTTLGFSTPSGLSCWPSWPAWMYESRPGRP